VTTQHEFRYVAHWHTDLPEDALREVGFTKPEVPEMPLGYAGTAPAEAPAEPVSH